LTYDQYRDIRFQPAKAIWRGTNLPFELQMFHPGRYYTEPVRISEIVSGRPREIVFDPAYFDYGKNNIDPAASAWTYLFRGARPFCTQQSEVQGRGPGVPGCELFPRAGQGPALWIVGARSRRRYGACLR